MELHKVSIFVETDSGEKILVDTYVTNAHSKDAENSSIVIPLKNDKPAMEGVSEH